MAWKIVGTAMMAAGLLGCSVHSQAPVRQVAYDFSDHAYYDRDFAPSPNYSEAQGYYGQAWVAPVAYGHAHTDCGCGHDHAGSAAPTGRGGHAETATPSRDERRPARPRVDFDSDRDGSTASGRVDRTPAAPSASDARDASNASDASDASRDGSRTRPRFTTSRPAAPASEGEGRAEPAARARPTSPRPEVARPAEAQSRRAAPAARPTFAAAAAADGRRSSKTAGDDRIARR
jgi:hypothetical protein